ncbi:Cys-tRNA(Pro) deacylase [Actinomarinicola tropica]|uniref:Cys-tRNA(Pro)/Cys-tRNA(Cys) deacylase n=1 Tax=Actinomarinicola tropica TaxID=2789776 RepID=A0A5Q2RKV8_9ACTN|nr:Cys-tRNA(Pro) deacylase [Actinomarinicola tropica]QGG95211.1 Cys-tRNA(Pro) deacylase [Actinomarinicola tropica]
MARRKERQASGTPATAALVDAGVPHVVHTYAHDPAASSYGVEAADALGVDPDRIFKTLLADVGGELVVGVVPVTAQLDLKALAAAVGARRATMADPAVAERRTGYVVGGISPLGQRRSHRTVIDDSARGWDTIHVSGGRRGLEVELAPDDLARLTDATFAPLARRA